MRPNLEFPLSAYCVEKINSVEFWEEVLAA